MNECHWCGSPAETTTAVYSYPGIWVISILGMCNVCLESCWRPLNERV